MNSSFNNPRLLNTLWLPLSQTRDSFHIYTNAVFLKIVFKCFCTVWVTCIKHKKTMIWDWRYDFLTVFTHNIIHCYTDSWCQNLLRLSWCFQFEKTVTVVGHYAAFKKHHGGNQPILLDVRLNGEQRGKWFQKRRQQCLQSKVNIIKISFISHQIRLFYLYIHLFRYKDMLRICVFNRVSLNYSTCTKPRSSSTRRPHACYKSMNATVKKWAACVWCLF